MMRNELLTWVGVAGFEPAASSSRSNTGASVLVWMSRRGSPSPAQTL
jgi:hypothetical protein